MRSSSSPGSRQGRPYDEVLRLSPVEPSWWASSGQCLFVYKIYRCLKNDETTFKDTDLDQIAVF